MGSIVSRSQAVLPAAEQQQIDSKQLQPSSSSVSIVKWKILPTIDEARAKFEADGTKLKFNDPDRLQLRIMLEDPISQRTIASYAKIHVQLDILMCWVDAQEFRTIPTKDYRRSKALHIYHKYIKSEAVLEIGGVSSEEKQRIAQLIEESKNNPDVLLTEDLFEKVQVFSFSFLLFHHTFTNNISFRDNYVLKYMELPTRHLEECML